MNNTQKRRRLIFDLLAGCKKFRFHRFEEIWSEENDCFLFELNNSFECEPPFSFISAMRKGPHDGRRVFTAVERVTENRFRVFTIHFERVAHFIEDIPPDMVELGGVNVEINGHTEITTSTGLNFSECIVSVLELHEILELRGFKKMSCLPGPVDIRFFGGLEKYLHSFIENLKSHGEKTNGC